MLLMALTLSVGVSAQQRSAGDKVAKIWFATDEIRFKPFDLSHPVQKTQVMFYNRGTAKLVINDVQVSCDCTKATFPEKFVAPGDSGIIEITYSAYEPGSFYKDVYVISNGVPSTTHLRLMGEVLPAASDKSK